MSAAKRQKMGGIPDFGNAAKWSFDDDDEEGIGGGNGGASTPSKHSDTMHWLTVHTLPTPIMLSYNDVKCYAPRYTEAVSNDTCFVKYTTGTGLQLTFPFSFPSIHTKKADESTVVSVSDTFSFFGFVCADAGGGGAARGHPTGSTVDCHQAKLNIVSKSGRERTKTVSELSDKTAVVTDKDTPVDVMVATFVSNYAAFFETLRFDTILGTVKTLKGFGTKRVNNVYSKKRGRFLLALNYDMGSKAGAEVCQVTGVTTSVSKDKINLKLEYGGKTRQVTFWASSAPAFFGTSYVSMRTFKDRRLLLFVESNTFSSYQSFDLIGVYANDATVYGSDVCANVRSDALTVHIGDAVTRISAEASKGKANNRPTPRYELPLAEGGSVPLFTYKLTKSDELVIPCKPFVSILKRLAKAAVDSGDWSEGVLQVFESMTPADVKATIETIDADIVGVTSAASSALCDDDAGSIDEDDLAVMGSGDEDDAPAASTSASVNVSPLHKLVEWYRSADVTAGGDDQVIRNIGIATVLNLGFTNATDFLCKAARIGVRRRAKEENTETNDEVGLGSGMQSGDEE